MNQEQLINDIDSTLKSIRYRKQNILDRSPKILARIKSAKHHASKLNSLEPLLFMDQRLLRILREFK